MKKLATKLTPAIKAWIKEEFGNDWYENYSEHELFHHPYIIKSERDGFHAAMTLWQGYKKVSEKKFLREYAKQKQAPIFQFKFNEMWVNCAQQENYRIKPSKKK
jgi:hypothetical protein